MFVSFLCIESIYIVAYKNSVSSCSESEILHLLCTVFPVVPLFYAIQSLEQLVSMLHCHHAEEKQAETVTFYGIAVIKLITI